MRRVMVIGGGGAEKSTLARKLAARLELSLIHLDFHHWGVGWQPTVRLLSDRDADDFLAALGVT